MALRLRRKGDALMIAVAAGIALVAALALLLRWLL
jgi:hypothetical protein